MIPFSLFLIAVFVLVSYYDLKAMIIPDWVNIALGLVGLFRLLTSFSMEDSLLKVLVAAAVGLTMLLLRQMYFAYRGIHGIGLGDVKFISAATIWIGFFGLPSMMLLACTTGILSHLIVSIRNCNYRWNRRVPFGPHLAFALFFTWSFGPIEHFF